MHSPLVGPSTWRWVAQELRATSNDVLVPTISSAALRGGWRAVAQGIAEQVSGSTGAVFVAHSGAGPLLPEIAQLSGAVVPSFIFVDAGVASRSHPTPLLPAAMLITMQAMAIDGQLPPWSEWFGPNAMQTLIASREMRRTVEEEIPRVPLAYFTDSVPLIASWPAGHNGYVQLSEAYDADAAAARDRGWPVVNLNGQHLDIVCRAAEVVAAIRTVGPK